MPLSETRRVFGYGDAQAMLVAARDAGHQLGRLEPLSVREAASRAEAAGHVFEMPPDAMVLSLAETLSLIRYVQQRKMHPQPMGGDSPSWLLERWLEHQRGTEVVPDRVRDRVRADRATVEPDEAPS